MAKEQLDPDALRRMMAGMTPAEEKRAQELLEEAAAEYVGALPDAELVLGPGTRLATDADFLVDELGIRPEGWEAPN